MFEVFTSNEYTKISNHCQSNNYISNVNDFGIYASVSFRLVIKFSLKFTQVLNNLTMTSRKR